MFTYRLNNLADVVFVKNEEGDVTITFYMYHKVVIFMSSEDDNHKTTTKTTIDPYKINVEKLDGFSGACASEFVCNLGYCNDEHSIVLNIASLLL